MKILKTYRYLFPLVAIPLLLICVGILWFFTEPVVQFFKIHWLFLAIALITIFTPIGKIRLGVNQDEKPKYRPAVWLAQLFLLQICLLGIFLGISTVCGETAPVLSPNHSLLFQKSLTQLLVNEGLFPWGFYALMAVCMGYHAYYRQQDAYLGTVAWPFKENIKISVTTNFIGRFATLSAYGITFALIALLWASVFTTTPIVTGFSLTPMLVTIILIVISSTGIFKRNISKVLGREIPLIPGIFSYVIILAAGIWLINGFLAPISNLSLVPPGILSKWLNEPWQDLWMIFANCWWLLWMPFIGIIIAKISRGYRVREVILAILLLPLLLGVAMFLASNLNLNIAPIAVVFLAGLSLLGFLAISLQSRLLPSLLLCYLPKADDYKFRSYRFTFIKILQITIFFLFIYLPAGMVVIHLLIFTLALPLIFIGLSSIAKIYFR